MTRSAASQVPLHPLLSERWSPRGFDAQHTVSHEALTALLEAARWASSANNTQPWRFLVARRGDRDFATLVELLAAGNQVWAQHASALVLVAAETVDPSGNARGHALYDTGQAVAQLVAQAQAEGLATHQMGGFDVPATVDTFGLPSTVTPSSSLPSTGTTRPPSCRRFSLPASRRRARGSRSTSSCSPPAQVPAGPPEPTPYDRLVLRRGRHDHHR